MNNQLIINSTIRNLRLADALVGITSAYKQKIIHSHKNFLADDSVAQREPVAAYI